MFSVWFWRGKAEQTGQYHTDPVKFRDSSACLSSSLGRPCCCKAGEEALASSVGVTHSPAVFPDFLKWDFIVLITNRQAAPCPVAGPSVLFWTARVWEGWWEWRGSKLEKRTEQVMNSQEVVPASLAVLSWCEDGLNCSTLAAALKMRILIWITIAEMKRHNQRQAGKERAYLAYTFTL